MTWRELRSKLSTHAHRQYEDVYEESYLRRLWTLPECFLSHSIRFVVNENGKTSILL